MAVAKRGALFYACRGVLRLKNLGWRTEVEQFPEPCVYICSHSNMAGPLTTLAQLPFPVRPWVLHLFFDREDCRRQFADYTFSQRFGMPKWLAGVLARLTAGLCQRPGPLGGGHPGLPGVGPPGGHLQGDPGGAGRGGQRDHLPGCGLCRPQRPDRGDLPRVPAAGAVLAAQAREAPPLRPHPDGPGEETAALGAAGAL